MRLVQRIAICVLLVLGSPALGYGQEKPSLYMLSVGIDAYAPPMNPLKGCVNDAIGMAKVFRAQEGKRFARVETVVLSDAKATRNGILKGITDLELKGAARDWYVILLSGHGGITRERWNFITRDGLQVSDSVLLNLADRLAGDGKQVVIIIDACNSGQLRYAANDMLNRHTDPSKGGIIVMVSSMAGQLSSALGVYSAFARAVEEGLSGQADYDGDERINLNELRRFTFNRVYSLNSRRGTFPGFPPAYQDSAIDASVSVPDTTVLVHAKKPAPPLTAPQEQDVASPYLTEQTWRLNIPAQGKDPAAAYVLRFDPFGHYVASLSRDNKLVGVSQGVYKPKAKSIHFVHHQGVDRAEVVAIGPTDLHLRFSGRDFKLKNVTPPKGTLLVDATHPLSEDDARDRVRTGSPHKVHVVELQAGSTYVIDMQSPDLDSFLRLEDEQGKQLAEDDDSGGGHNARMTFRPAQTGKYRVIATTFGGGAGLYHLHVAQRDAAHPPSTTVTAQTILKVDHEFTGAEPRDRLWNKSSCREYKIELKAGVSYTIDMVSTDIDSYLRLEDDSGKQLAVNDDGGGYPNARLTFTPARSGTHTIVATTYQTPKAPLKLTGRYTLTVRAPGEQPIATSPQPSQPPRPTVASQTILLGKHTLTTAEPMDRIRKDSHCRIHKIELKAGVTYTIDMTSSDLDAYLRLEDDTGMQIAFNDNKDETTRNSQIVFAPAQSGAYTILATTTTPKTGGYMLIVRALSGQQTATPPQSSQPPRPTAPAPRQSSLFEAIKPLANAVEFGSDRTAFVKGTLAPADPKNVTAVGLLRAYSLKLGADRSYMIDLAGVGDFRIIVFDSSGATVASQSGLANPRESIEVVFRPARDDTYWIVVTTFLGEVRSERAFTLRIRAQGPPGS